jgi:gliding motility-associated-like protein
MKQITFISIILLLLISGDSYAQVQLGRQVIGSTGGYATGTNITLSSTVGEAVVQTVGSGNLILTQGFQQTFKGGDSTVTAEIYNESCRGANDGEIMILNVLGCPGPYTTVIRSLVDSSIITDQDGLATAEYLVVITGANGCKYPILLFVGVDSDQDCRLKFYSGITPNGDGQNDVWIIDNIEQFPENTVEIFNRWGQSIWWGEGYDNDIISWRGNNGNNDEGDQMADGTYFYVAEVAGEIYRGWVELTR